MTTPNQPVIDNLRKGLIVPVFYHEDAATCTAVMSICFEEGIEVFEFTNRGEHAAKNFEALQQEQQKHFPGRSVGIGTVKTIAEAGIFLPFEPDFLVSPVVNTAVGKLCSERSVPWMPGCLTPTEIQEAVENGAAVVKIFPASAYGPSYIRAVRAVFPGVHLMPTGGIRAEKQVLGEWFEAGVHCVGMGSELLERGLVRDKNWPALREKIRRARQLVLSCIS